MVLDIPTRALLSLAHHNAIDALKRFVLFNGDVEGAILSFRLFDELKVLLNPTKNVAMMYHASCFICAVRRASRLLESLSNNGTCFRDPVAKVVRLEWRKKRAFFEKFRKPRDAIEHIDEKVKDKTNWSFFNLDDDHFYVVDRVSVEINHKSLDTLCSARDVIAVAIIQEYRDPTLDFLDTAMST